MLSLCTFSTVRLLRRLFVCCQPEVDLDSQYTLQKLVHKNGDCLNCLIRKEKYKEAPKSKFSIRVVAPYLT